ncbi:uncharacterized protein DEA37_0008550, partial [Paragonimus westermani]
DKCDSGICCISPSNHLNLLGIDWIEKLDLWNVPSNYVCDEHSTIHLSKFCDVATIPSKLYSDFVQQLLDTFPDVFTNNLGKCTEGKAHLFIEPGSRLVFCPKRPVPHSTTTALEAELDRSEATEVLAKVNYSSRAAPVVTVKKQTAPFDFVTERIGHVDALSKLVAHKSSNHPSEDVVISSVEVDADVKYVFRESIKNLPVTSTMIRCATQSDPLLQAITYYSRMGWPEE